VEPFGDVSLELTNFIATAQIHRPPHNYFDHELIHDLAEAVAALDLEPACRAVVLASEGKSFCAGSDFQGVQQENVGRLYEEALRLFAARKPIVAAIQGAAVGGGLGLALVADFRVASPDARFVANFTKIGIHPGFALTYTLPRLIGPQRASLMFYSGKRVKPDEALSWRLVDVTTSPEELRAEARRLAQEIAVNAPLAVVATRATLRQGMVEAVRSQLNCELEEQNRLFRSDDFREGVRAVNERRPGRFIGR